MVAACCFDKTGPTSVGSTSLSLSLSSPPLLVIVAQPPDDLQNMDFWSVLGKTHDSGYMVLAGKKPCIYRQVPSCYIGMTSLARPRPALKRRMVMVRSRGIAE